MANTPFTDKLSQQDFIKYCEETENQIEELSLQIEKKIQSINPILLIGDINQEMITSVNFPEYEKKLPTDFPRKFQYIMGLVAKQKHTSHELDSAIFRDASQKETIEEIISQTNELYTLYMNLWTYRPSLSGSFNSEEMEDYKIRYLSFLIALFQDELGYSEQFIDRMKKYFEPFDDTFFVRDYNFTISDCISLSQKIIDEVSTQYLSSLKKYRAFFQPYEDCRMRLINKEISFEEMVKFGKDNPIDSEAYYNLLKEMNCAFIISEDFILENFSKDVLESYLNCFSFISGEINNDFRFPTDYNELSTRFIERLSPGRLLVYNPSYLFVRLYSAIEGLILSSKLQSRFYKKRDVITEKETYDCLVKLFPASCIFQNAHYGGANGLEFEADLIILYDRSLIICEVKSKALRSPQFTFGNTDKIRDDFKVSIQKAYEQAVRTSEYIGEKKKAVFQKKNGEYLAEISCEDFDSIVMVAVTAKSFGPLSADLSLLLDKKENAYYPIALNIFDFQLLVEKLDSAEKFIDYCKQRCLLHGFVKTHDELDYAGYYFKYGNLDFSKHRTENGPDQILLDGRYSKVFDDALCVIGKLDKYRSYC